MLTQRLPNSKVSLPLASLKVRNCREIVELMKAGARIRTADLLITNQLLYRLSYASPLGRTPPEDDGEGSA